MVVCRTASSLMQHTIASYQQASICQQLPKSVSLLPDLSCTIVWLVNVECDVVFMPSVYASSFLRLHRGVGGNALHPIKTARSLWIAQSCYTCRGFLGMDQPTRSISSFIERKTATQIQVVSRPSLPSRSQSTSVTQYFKCRLCISTCAEGQPDAATML